jgi:photosystem II stability/assembly factor-like uncharacterized protein
MATKKASARAPKRRQERTPKSLSTRKDRSIWYFQRASFPLRDAPPTELEQAWKELNAHHRSDPPVEWEEAGPHNIAGRATSLIVHPTDWNTLYSGAAGGGVWVSRNAGETWSTCWPREATHNIGALAVHPRSPSILIAATGEANLSPDSYPGTGFYTSMDGGESWSPTFVTPDGKPLPDELREMIPRRVGTMAFDPFELRGTRAAGGSVTHDERMRAGLYLLDPSHGLIPCLFWGTRSYNCYSVLYHPQREGMLFAAIETRGAQNGIWCSDDRGATWKQLRVGLPSPERFRRTSLAISPSHPDIMYALVADRDKRVLGIYQTVNHGESWQEIGRPEQFPDERFMSYNNTIVVHPDKPEFVIWGGARLHRTTDAGDHWDPITFPISKTRYVHDDHHALVMPHGDVIYSANDGGVAVSKDGGETWNQRSFGMVTTMFYDIDVAPTNSRMFGGGAQDNGTLISRPRGKHNDFVQAFTGDGGWLVFDPADDEHVFGSAQKIAVYRHRRGEPWTKWVDKSPSCKLMTETERTQRDIAIIAIEPSTEKGIKKVWAGTHRLWRTDDDGDTWEPTSDTFDGSAISAIEISSVIPQLMFVGTTNGGVFRSSDGGATWTDDLAGVDMPRRLITRIETHPQKADTVVVTAAVQSEYSNVFQSDDLGVIWTDIDKGALPHVMFNAAVFETREPYRLFVAGDAGVFVKSGTGWVPLLGNLPNVVVSDLVYHDKDQLLFAATYGRGIWRLRTDTLEVGL